MDVCGRFLEILDQKTDQKVTHFYEFNGTKNVSLFDQPLHIFQP